MRRLGVSRQTKCVRGSKNKSHSISVMKHTYTFTHVETHTQVSYEVTVSGGDSAASDVDALLPQLSTGDEAAARKLWGDKLVDDNSITGSAASSPDPEPASPDGTTPNDGAAASHLVGLALCLGLLGAFLV